MRPFVDKMKVLDNKKKLKTDVRRIFSNNDICYRKRVKKEKVEGK